MKGTTETVIGIGIGVFVTCIFCAGYGVAMHKRNKDVEEILSLSI